MSVEGGSFYGGRKLALGLSRGRVNITPQFAVEPSVSINRVDVPQGAFTTHLVAGRITFNMTPRMFVSALAQYSSDGRATAVNARLRWEYRPGSELFLVYNEQRDDVGRRLPELANRTFIVKVNRLFRF